MVAIRHARPVAVSPRKSVSPAPDRRRGAGRRLRARAGGALLLTAALLVCLGAAALVAAAPASAGPPAGSAASPSGSADALLALLAVQQAQLLASDGGTGDCFGHSVAIDGNTAVVGAYTAYDNDQGSAYVFVRNGITWSQQDRLERMDAAAGDLFGCSVAIDGDTIVVGCEYDDGVNNANQGSAYVYTHSGTYWSQQQKLTAVDQYCGDDYFGSSVAISGDTIMVGTPGRGLEGPSFKYDVGAVYVFTRSGTTWSQRQKLMASSSSEFDHFGAAVAISGDTAVIGVPDSDYPSTDQGCAYIFVRSGTTWSQKTQLSAAGGNGDGFGSSVAIDGNRVVVGAPRHDLAPNVDQGEAFVYVYTYYWHGEGQLTAVGGAAGDQFGNSVAISGDTVVVGARLDDVGSYRDQGSACVFTRSGTTWSEQQKLTASDGRADDLFANSVAISGDTILVGARDDDVGAYGGYVDRGSAYVFAPPDTTAPVTTDDTDGLWHKAAVTVHFSATDGGSGVSYTQWSTNGGTTWTNGASVVIAAPADHSADGSHTISYRSIDRVGNTETPAKSCTVKIDTQRPSTTDDVNDTAWHGAVVTVHLTATDPSPGSGMSGGSAKTEYKLDGAAGWSTGTSVPVSGDGIHTVVYRSTDAAGNLETPDKSCTVKIDTRGPTTVARARCSVRQGRKATFKYRVNDPVPGSPTARVTIKVKKRSGATVKTLKPGVKNTNVNLTYPWTCKLKKGSYRWWIYATDAAGNVQVKIGKGYLTVN